MCKINLSLELFDHSDLRELLEAKITSLKKAAFKIETLMKAMDATEFNWENPTTYNLETMQKLIDTITSEI